MKKLLFLLFFLPLVSFGQEDIDRYKLYKTTNMWTFLKLDTSTGKISQIQYTVGEGDSMQVTLSDEDLTFGETENGRFELYPTDNMYNFLLLDQKTGSVVQVQWSQDAEYRGIVHRFSEGIEDKESTIANRKWLEELRESLKTKMDSILKDSIN